MRIIYLSILSISSIGLLLVQPILYLLGIGFNPVVLINAIGIGHVAATSYFVTDLDYRRLLVRKLKWLVIIPIPVLIYLISPTLATIGFFAFLSWQFFHVTRQSYGLIAFSNGGHVANRRLVNILLNLVAVAGVIGSLAFMSNYPLGSVEVAYEIRVGLQVSAFILYTVSLPILVYLCMKTRGFSLVMLFSGWGLFVGPALSGSIASLAMCGLNHAVQYWMLVITSSWQANRTRAILWLGCLTIIITPLFYLMTTHVIWQKIFFGLFAVHFLLDANMWHLSDEQQRKICMNRFGFLLK